MRMAVVILMFACLSVSSCGLVKKATKSSSQSSFDSSKHTVEQFVDLQKKDKVTHSFSYWNDSVLYQYNVVKEQIDQARAGSFKIQEQQEQKQEQVVKQSEPAKEWLYAWVGIALIGLLLVFKKLAPL